MGDLGGWGGARGASEARGPAHLQSPQEPLQGGLAHRPDLAAVKANPGVWTPIGACGGSDGDESLAGLQQNPQDHKPGLHVSLRGQGDKGSS